MQSGPTLRACAPSSSLLAWQLATASETSSSKTFPCSSIVIVVADPSNESANANGGVVHPNENVDESATANGGDCGCESDAFPSCALARGICDVVETLHHPRQQPADRTALVVGAVEEEPRD